MAIKKSTVGYMHPAVRVASADGACFGRNYFNRSSAPEAEEGELEEERARVLVEAASLKKSAWTTCIQRWESWLRMPLPLAATTSTASLHLVLNCTRRHLCRARAPKHLRIWQLSRIWPPQ